MRNQFQFLVIFINYIFNSQFLKMISQKIKPKSTTNNIKNVHHKQFTLFPFNSHKANYGFTGNLQRTNLSNKHMISKGQGQINKHKQNKSYTNAYPQKIHDQNEDIANTYNERQHQQKYHQVNFKQMPNINKQCCNLPCEVFQSHSFLKLEDLSNTDISFSSLGFKQGHKGEVESYMKYQQKVVQNQEEEDRDNKIYINMKKKIKKVNKIKLNQQPKNEHNQNLNTNRLQPSQCQKFDTNAQQEPLSLYDQCLNQAYNDSEVINNIQEYKEHTISHRIDNDVESDDQQIKTGIKKMHTFLVNVINEQKHADLKSNVKNLYAPKMHFGRIY